jgi:hypothetical protein
MPGFAQAPRHSYEDGLARLAADLSDGTWQREHAALIERDVIDGGLSPGHRGPIVTITPALSPYGEESSIYRPPK